MSHDEFTFARRSYEKLLYSHHCIKHYNELLTKRNEFPTNYLTKSEIPFKITLVVSEVI